ncbi:hypothetical protein ACFQMM_10870 [Saliphagus sp. GCM10025308]
MRSAQSSPPLTETGNFHNFVTNDEYLAPIGTESAPVQTARERRDRRAGSAPAGWTLG